jgi:hypothetical protein
MIYRAHIHTVSLAKAKLFDCIAVHDITQLSICLVAQRRRAAAEVYQRWRTSKGAQPLAMLPDGEGGTYKEVPVRSMKVCRPVAHGFGPVNSASSSAQLRRSGNSSCNRWDSSIQRISAADTPSLHP